MGTALPVGPGGVGVAQTLHCRLSPSQRAIDIFERKRCGGEIAPCSRVVNRVMNVNTCFVNLSPRDDAIPPRPMLCYAQCLQRPRLNPPRRMPRRQTGVESNTSSVTPPAHSTWVQYHVLWSPMFVFNTNIPLRKARQCLPVVTLPSTVAEQWLGSPGERPRPPPPTLHMQPARGQG